MHTTILRSIALVSLTLGAAPLPAQVESITVDAAAPTQPFPHFWERMFGSGRAVLELIEPVGNEAFLNTRAGDTELLLRVSPHSLPAPGAEVTLTFSPERLHLFDPETGRRVGRP